MDTIEKLVHRCYWQDDINCACTTLKCLETLFHMQVEDSIYTASVGLHGAGGYRAQCGLVEGALLFIGLYSQHKGKSKEEAVSICYNFAANFDKRFGSLQCYFLRPNGFTENDPPHACESLTVNAITFIYQFIEDTFF